MFLIHCCKSILFISGGYTRSPVACATKSIVSSHTALRAFARCDAGGLVCWVGQDWGQPRQQMDPHSQGLWWTLSSVPHDPCTSPVPTLLASLGQRGRCFPQLTGCLSAPARAGCHGTVLPRGCWHSLSLATALVITCHKVSSVIAELHKGMFMLSPYCLPHESNYRSCHGGSEQKGVNFMGVIFA